MFFPYLRSVFVFGPWLLRRSRVFCIFADALIGRCRNPSQRYDVAPPLRTIRRETVKKEPVLSGGFVFLRSFAFRFFADETTPR